MMLHDEFEKIDLKDFICRNAPGLCKRWNQKEESTQTQTQEYSPYQKAVVKNLWSAYRPYIGEGTLGGLSDLEQSALNMLKSADVWSPLTTTGTGLLTGTLGASKLSPEQAASSFENIVAKPATRYWEETVRPTVQEAYAGPGYWSGARARAESESAQDMAESLGTERARWMWDVEQANRAIEEAKAGRALSAMGVVPSSLLGWAGGISGIGRNAQQILNQITDPQVLAVLQSIMGARPSGATYAVSERTPSELQKWGNWFDLGSQAMDFFSALPGGGGAGGMGSSMSPQALGSITGSGYYGGFPMV